MDAFGYGLEYLVGMPKAREKKAEHKPKPWQNVETGKKPGQPRELKHEKQGKGAKPGKWCSLNEAHLECKSKHKRIYKDLDDARKVQQLQTINIQQSALFASAGV